MSASVASGRLFIRAKMTPLLTPEGRLVHVELSGAPRTYRNNKNGSVSFCSIASKFTSSGLTAAVSCSLDPVDVGVTEISFV